MPRLWYKLSKPPTGSHTARGHDLTLLQELQELIPAQRITRNCEMADWIEKLQAALRAHATLLPSPDALR